MSKTEISYTSLLAYLKPLHSKYLVMVAGFFLKCCVLIESQQEMQKYFTIHVHYRRLKLLKTNDNNLTIYKLPHEPESIPLYKLK